MYHGWADPALSAYATIDYYDRVARASGGDASTFARLFLAPGMHHCAGGPGPNAFITQAVEALEAWVEHGRPPTAIVATHTNPAGAVDRTRPLCPHPQIAKYNG